MAETSRQIRILLVDDHHVLREGIVSILDAVDDLFVAGEAESGEQAIELAKQLEPDVMLLDLNLPDMSGLEVARRVLADDPQMTIVALTAYDYVQYVREALEIGVSGYLLKSANSSEIIQAIRKAAAGDKILDPRISDQVFEAFGKRGATRRGDMTPREFEVLRHLADGKTNSDIGKALHLTTKTIESHVSSILGKLGVTNRTEAVRMSIDRGLLPGERIR